ncbi:MAG: TolC family protein [Prevotella sp.]|nr:TolC family protein [Prevotella sp.]
MKKGMIYLAGLLFCSLSTWAQKAWTLEDCINYAKEHNITLQKALLQKKSAEEDVKSSQAALLPSLSASTNQSVGYRPWQDNGTTTVTNGQVNTKVNKSYYNGNYGLNASWTVWNGNKNRNTLRQNRLSAEQAGLEAEVTANSIQEQIAQLYVQILYLTEAVKVSEQSLETSKKNEERGKEMVEVGKMSKADLAQLSAQRASDEYNIVESRANISKYKLQLKQLLELDSTQEFDIALTDITDEQALSQVPALQAVYNEALTTRPEIRSSELSVKSSNLSIAMAKAGWLPTLNMTAGFGTSTNSLSNNTWGSQLKTNFDASAGLTVSIPIFDQRQTKTSVNKARIQYMQAQLDLQDRQKELYQTIEGYWLDAETNQAKLRSAIATEESEQQSYDLLQEQFQLGLKNIVELMTGKDRLLTAQQNRLQSKYQAVLAQQMLKFYSGK